MISFCTDFLKFLEGGPGAGHLLNDIHTLGETSLCCAIGAFGFVLQMGKLRLGRHLGKC